MISNEHKNDKVLFLVRQYAPVPKVCEICVERVIKALYSIGIQSDVLQFTGNKGLVKSTEYGNIYSVGDGEGILDTTVKNKIKHFFKLVSIAYRWPFYYKFRTNRIYRNTIQQLNTQNNYSAIIGVSLPVDTVYNGSFFDNFIVYELDAITNNPGNNGKIKRLYKSRLNKIEKRVFDKASLIIHMNFNKTYFESKEFVRYCNKTTYSNIPNLIKPKTISQLSSDILVFSYFGTLVRDFRNPSYLITLFEEIKHRITARINFYTRGNCEDILENAKLRNQGYIFANGYISPEDVIAKQSESDFLLSIGNKLTGKDRSLPSKVFEYIATGKPIIHIHGGENDSAIEYLEKYELSCIINPSNNIIENANTLVDFIEKNKRKRLDFDLIKNLFNDNTPEYTADIIKTFIQNNQ